MKKVFSILPLAIVLFFACENKKSDDTKTASETEVPAEETSSEEKTEKSASAGSEAATAKTYAVADFVDAYTKDKSALKGQTVIVEGYYLNYNSQNDGTGEQYSIMLYPDEACDFKAKKAYFVFGADTDEKDLSMPQYSKIKIQGKVTGEESFNDPKLVEAKLVK